MSEMTWVSRTGARAGQEAVPAAGDDRVGRLEMSTFFLPLLLLILVTATFVSAKGSPGYVEYPEM